MLRAEDVPGGSWGSSESRVLGLGSRLRFRDVWGLSASPGGGPCIEHIMGSEGISWV